MTRDEYIKVCRICENRKQDYEHGMICSLTGRKADFADKCPSFVLDNDVVLQPQVSESFSQNTTNDDYYDSGFSWRTVLAIIVAIIAVVRLIATLNR